LAHDAFYSYTRLTSRLVIHKSHYWALSLKLYWGESPSLTSQVLPVGKSPASVRRIRLF